MYLVFQYKRGFNIFVMLYVSMDLKKIVSSF